MTALEPRINTPFKVSFFYVSSVFVPALKYIRLALLFKHNAILIIISFFRQIQNKWLLIHIYPVWGDPVEPGSGGRDCCGQNGGK